LNLKVFKKGEELDLSALNGFGGCPKRVNARYGCV